MGQQVASGQMVQITPKGERWVRTGHPWVYQNDLSGGNPEWSGQLVAVRSAGGGLLGHAFYNAKSKIALRWVSRDPEEKVDQTFWLKRLQEALVYRERLAIDAQAYRLIHSETDGFPGLIVDRYDSVLVLQVLSLGMAQILSTIVEGLTEKIHPTAMVARNDSPVRLLEGLAQEKTILMGERPQPLVVREGKIRYWVDVWEGQKTGGFLDQRENRIRASDFARGARVLDVFAYQGNFSLGAATVAQQVLAIEDSQAAVEAFRRNVKENRLSNIQIERSNAFDRLKEMERSGEKFDLIILDPPAFAKSRNDVTNALRGYREINLRALKMINPQGTLITCSCSFQISDEDFWQILRTAAADSHRTVRLIERRTQSRDHPILLTHPESRYLKCLILEVT